MTGFDILVLVVVGLTATYGFLRGFVQEAISLAAWAAALVAVRALHTPLSDVLAPHVGTSSGASVLAFLLLLLVPYLVVRMLARMIGSASRASVLGPVDRVLGFGFGAVKGTLIVVAGFTVLVLAYDTIWGADGRPTWITKSRTYPFINASSDALVQALAERRRQAREAAKADDADSAASNADTHPAPHHRKRRAAD